MAVFASRLHGCHSNVFVFKMTWVVVRWCPDNNGYLGEKQDLWKNWKSIENKISGKIAIVLRRAWEGRAGRRTRDGPALHCAGAFPAQDSWQIHKGGGQCEKNGRCYHRGVFFTSHPWRHRMHLDFCWKGHTTVDSASWRCSLSPSALWGRGRTLVWIFLCGRACFTNPVAVGHILSLSSALWNKYSQVSQLKTKTLIQTALDILYLFGIPWHVLLLLRRI